MPYTGQCNCESIRITLPEKPANCMLCHCTNCKRAGGGPCSLNYVVDLDDMSVEDPTGALKIFNDTKSLSGNVAQRHFCSNCGSPVVTKTPGVPGKGFLKAALFDSISPPGGHFFEQNKLEWFNAHL
ncbi:hypothetical protein MW887_006467 [Aspergillus wentii]|nr:hypothetical protein MW887_006467 [Aspergillus wentii]